MKQNQSFARLSNVVRLAVAVLCLGLVACGGTADQGATIQPAAGPTTNATAAPSGLVSPSDLERRVVGMSAVVSRVDRVTTRLMDTTQLKADFSSAVPPTWGPTQLFWVVAVVGEIRPDSIVDTGPVACKLVVFDARTGDVVASGGGSLKACAPYFNIDLTPPAAPVACGPEPWGYAYPGSSPTAPGPVTLLVARDDGWRRPTVAPASFLFEAPEGGGTYYETYCRSEHIVTVPPGYSDALILEGLGSPRVSGPVPAGMAQLWLKSYHAIEAIAGSNEVRVLIEPREGFEIASFDWHAVAPQGGYVTFRFVDRAGRELLPFAVANGP